MGLGFGVGKARRTSEMTTIVKSRQFHPLLRYALVRVRVRARLRVRVRARVRVPLLS